MPATTLTAVRPQAAAQTCCSMTWEEAYARFETPEQEVQKFVSRLRRLGVAAWSRDAETVELFCGRGNGLVALERLGFSRLTGIDLSPTLAAQYRGPAHIHVADCRELPLADGSQDAAIVQGGLHHLPSLPDDLERTLREAHRVLRPGGVLVVVEPWLTPFLSLVHRACRNRWACRLSDKVDALATMIRHEQTTYDAWLSSAGEILRLLDRFFTPTHRSIGWGKLMYVGRRS